MDKDEYNSNLEKLVRAKLHLSAHTIRGWHHQFGRMNRFYHRAKSAKNPTDELDFYISFFQNCFHLKDWIIEAQKNDEVNWSDKIHFMINNNQSMKICRDLCNGLKHLRISNPSIDKYFAIFYENRPFYKLDGSKEYGWSVFISKNNTNKPVRFLMEEIAKDCLEAWTNFINSEPALYQ